MKRFIVLSFIVMAVGYYELSGGADFQPEVRVIAEAEPPAETLVTRAETTVEIVTLDAPVTAPAADPAIEAALADIVPVVEPVVEPEPVQEASAQPVAAPVADLRIVTGSRVNLREGPGTDFSVLNQATEGLVMEVLEEGAAGWVRVRSQDGGLSGWMSSDFLAALNG